MPIKIFWFLICIGLCAGIGFFSVQIYKQTIPKAGTVLRYEDFRGYQVPIKANGTGGSYRWMKDVPWNVFTIEEKFEWAKVNGGWLSDKDIAEIKAKYGAR